MVTTEVPVVTDDVPIYLSYPILYNIVTLTISATSHQGRFCCR